MLVCTKTEAEVWESEDSPGEWVVWALDRQDGAMFVATFSGPGAKGMAEEYATAKFGSFRRRRPQPARPALSIVRDPALAEDRAEWDAEQRW